MKIDLLAVSSDGSGRYKVTLYDESGVINLICNCYAGDMGTLCRHRIALLTNKTRGIFYAKDNEQDNLTLAVDILERSGLSQKYRTLANQLEELEKQYKVDKKHLKSQMNNILLS